MGRFLSQLQSPRGFNKKKKRLGRGDSSGHGGTSTKGHKGQKSRSGGYHKLGFEGGQMPIARRLPKRGFTNISRREMVVVNVASLTQSFKEDSIVDLQALREQGLIRSVKKPVKILGNGEISIPLTIRAHAFSQSAIDKIQKAGGKVEYINSK